MEGETDPVEEILTGEEITQKLLTLPSYSRYTGERATGEQVWEGDENGVHYKVTKGQVASHSGMEQCVLVVSGGTEETRQSLISKFAGTLGPGQEIPSQEACVKISAWWNVDDAIRERKKQAEVSGT